MVPTQTIQSQSPSQICTISDYCIEKITIAKFCKDLNTRKSRGPDNVPPSVYMETAEAIASCLHYLQKHQAFWQVPDEMEKWNFYSHIQKKGSKSKVENYRHVTLLDIAGKIHERCIYFPLYNLFIKFMSSQQFGFQSRKSTIIQLLNCLHHIHFDIDNSKKGLLFFDFAKTFDKANHKILWPNYHHLDCKSLYWQLSRLFTKSTPGHQNQWSLFLVGACSQWCSSRVSSWTPTFSYFHQRFTWFNLTCIPLRGWPKTLYFNKWIRQTRS